MFMRPAFALFLRCVLLLFLRLHRPNFRKAIIKVSSYLESESQEGENEKPKTTEERTGGGYQKC